jgi:hypothetical protein
MIKAFPKIFQIGTDYISTIFEDEVEITEKIDGSQFVFGKINNQLYMRSRNKIQYLKAVDKLFWEASEYLNSVISLLPNGTIFYCEYLKAPKHNALAYGRVPKNHLALFGICDTAEKFISEYESLTKYAELLDIDVVPLVFKGKVDSVEMFNEFLELDSYLGNVKIEGIVVKNYHKKFLLGGMPMPLMAGKYVSEKFKEKNEKNWKSKKTSKGRFETFKEGFKTEARWQKAVQHLKENGTLLNAPQDIGALIKAVKEDIAEEEMEYIKNFLWKEFSPEILSFAVRGLPEWYKQKLAKNSFEKELKDG